jgi:trimeric autotransporter adhesin
MPSAACNGSQGFSGDGGPATQFQVSNGSVPAQLAGTTVSFNGVNGPIVYTSNTQVAAIVPYEVTGSSAQVVVSYQGQASPAFTVPVAASAPSLFSLNETGAGQAAAINAVDNTVNTAANPVKIGGYISLYATGQGQTTPAGVDGKVASGPVLPMPNLQVSATVGGIPAVVQYAGGAPGEVAGVMQVNVQIPAGVQPGGYVPVVLTVGSASNVGGAAWIAVAGN